MNLERISPSTQALIERILRESFADWNFVDFGVEPRPDGFGDPAIYITARFEPLDATPPVGVKSRTMLRIFDALRADDDPRIPILDYEYPAEPEDIEAA